MYKGSLQNFFLAKTAHRVPKILTLAISSAVLLAMVNIDASASAFGGRDSNAVRTDVVLTLASESSNSQFSGLVKRWTTVTTTSGTTSPTTATTSVGGFGPTLGNSGAGGSGGGTSGGGGGGAPSTTTSTTSPPTTTTTAAPTTTTTNPPSSSAGTDSLITAGPSHSECAELNFSDTGLASLQAAVTSWDNTTNTTTNCVLAYLNGAPTWAQWEDPWITSSQYGYAPWVAQEPQSRQVVLQVDLIPDSLENVSDPLSWEQSCAAGDFNSFATQLGTNLVAAGLQNSVIRLGAEMNGTWEADYMGSTTQEQQLWATCFANEVTGLRAASGENFLIDWDPNSCNIPYSTIYPGNAYVDIIGIDLYDQACQTPSTAVSFSALASEGDGLDSIEAFATSQGKPMSLPEWGLESSPAGDDPAYIDGMGSAFSNGDYAFEAYFDAGAQGTMELGPSTPLSLVEFQKWFAQG
jgi:Glycosyl hydrolase family 26